MKYQLQRKGKPAECWLPEEQQVFEALRAFTFDPERTRITDFTPTRVMYETYRQFVDSTPDRPDAPEVLNLKQFGAALNRVFRLDDSRWSRRHVGGRRVNGYIFVRGPGSVIAHAGPGNPNLMRRTPVVMFQHGQEARLAG